MTEKKSTTRRRFMKGVASLAVASAVGVGQASASSGWKSVKTPTGNTIHDVEYAADGPYAVAGGGIVLKRTSMGWKKILDGGPTGNGNNLYGADVTDDGKRLWFVGASGAIGEYDVETGDLNDHSAPMDVTNNFNDVSVTGEAGEANVYVAGDSGKVYYSFENGATQTWDYVTPGSGSSIQAIDFHGPRSGHCVDTNGKVFSTDDGSTWDAIGIGDANVNFYGVDSDSESDVNVSGGGGMVFRYDGSRWIPSDLGDASLRDIEVEADKGYTVGGGGKVFRKDGKWKQEKTPTGQNLKAVVRGSVDIAVGAGGTVIEKK